METRLGPARTNHLPANLQRRTKPEYVCRRHVANFDGKSIGLQMPNPQLVPMASRPEQLDVRDLQVHHLQSRGSLGDDAEENLITLCEVCHRRTHFR